MLLTNPDVLPDALDQFLTSNAGTINEAFVYGGPHAVGESVLETTRASIS